MSYDASSQISGHVKRFTSSELNQSIGERFKRQVLAYGDRLAIKSVRTEFTYSQLNQVANQIANAIWDCRENPEEPIALLLDDEVSFTTSMLAILKLGRIFVPLDPTYPLDRIHFMLEDSGCSLILTEEHLEPRALLLAGRSHQVLNISRLDSSERMSDPQIAVSPDRMSHILYTSGSTGKPKGVVQNHRCVLHNVMKYTNSFKLCPDDRWTLLFSVSFGEAMNNLFCALLNGSAIFPWYVMRDGINNLADWLHKNRITIYHSVPTLFRLFVLQLRGSGQLPDLRIINLSGEPAFRQDVLALRKRFSKNCVLVNSYGSTETKLIAQHFVTEETVLTGAVIPVGYPAEDTKVLLLDSSGCEVSPEEPGEIVVQSRYLSTGYWFRPKLTAERFQPDPEGGDERFYWTGDYGRRCKDGSLEYLGRKDSQIKLKGYRVELQEIEAVLIQHPQVRETAVLITEEAGMEKRLVAYIVPNEDPTPSVDMLRNHLKAKLPDYMIPSVFVVLEKFPLTPNGKIDRKGLTVPDRINIGSEAAFVAPRDTLELQLTNIWKEILGVENIGIKDNFFELGGDSLLAAQLFAKIEEILGENLPLATILQTPTIEQLANIFREKEWKSIWSSLVAIQSDGSKPPLFLIHGAEGNVLLYRKLAQYLGPDQPVFGLQSQGLDGKKDYHTRIESMAANYIKEIRSLQFEGPYYLGGYCMGGTVAYEMAQQLRGKGQKTALLVMLETHNMQFNPKALSMRYKVYRKLQNIKFHLENLLSLSPKDKSTFFFEKANVEISRFKVSIDMLISKMANKLNIHKELSYPHVFISKVNDQAQIKYLPKVYKGRITIFRPKKCFAGLDDPQLGWGKLTDLGLDIHDIPVNPKGMLVEPFVQLLGNELKDCINKAVENGL